MNENAVKDDAVEESLPTPPVVSEDPKGVVFHPSVMLPIDKIDLNEWNPNEMDEKTFNRLVREIRDNGFVEAIQVVPYEKEETGEVRYLVMGGEHRYRAVQLLKQKEIPAIILTDPKLTSEEEQKALTIRLNALRGKLNKEKMVKLFHEFAVNHSNEQIQDMFAFTKKDEWEKLVGETRKNLKKSGMPPELLAEFDKTAKEAKTVNDLGQIIQRLYEMYKDTVPFGFMVFTWGKKEHIYVAMTKETKTAMDKLVAIAKETKADLNTLIAPALEKAAEEIAGQKAKA